MSRLPRARPSVVALFVLQASIRMSTQAAAEPGAVTCHAVAVAGGPYAAACDPPVAVVALDGSGSPRCPGDKPDYLWSTNCPGASFDDPASLTAVLSFSSPPPCPIECRVTLTAIDMLGNRDSDSATVTVDDTAAPTGGGEGTVLAELWPPDHRYVCFGPEWLARAFLDDCSGVASWQVTRCRSSEADDAIGGGDGHTSNDCRIEAGGERVCVRRERSGAGSGRWYALVGVATDVCGNRSNALELGGIRVPHQR